MCMLKKRGYIGPDILRIQIRPKLVPINSYGPLGLYRLWFKSGHPTTAFLYHKSKWLFFGGVVIKKWGRFVSLVNRWMVFSFVVL